MPGRLRSRESIAVTLSLGLVVTGLGTTACDSSSACRSPRAISQRYAGDTDPRVIEANQKTWRLGALVLTARPQDNVIVGFETPNSQDHWHDSNPVPSAEAASIAMLIGRGPVEISTQYVAPAGSASCLAPPDTTFGPEQARDTLPKSAASPTWP